MEVITEYVLWVKIIEKSLYKHGFWNNLFQVTLANIFIVFYKQGLLNFFGHKLWGKFDVLICSVIIYYIIFFCSEN